ncbi:Hypothetical predicted protein [Cloeon dipterum]|uniref:Uncharacterized protein n=1 Tax=Cloeon dipterum TaxID=197152 RepID=A0A8S1CR99_9INSE|nr:Hypothetical predicted protein [Cloeon dipterum]
MATPMAPTGSSHGASLAAHASLALCTPFSRLWTLTLPVPSECPARPHAQLLPRYVQCSVCATVAPRRAPNRKLSTLPKGQFTPAYIMLLFS